MQVRGLMYNQKIELRHLRYFAVVAQEFHFSRAARKLHIAQPSLSQQISQLEQIVGVRLFERNHHRVTLTNAGQVFLKEIHPILNQIECALANAQKAQRGLIGKLSVGYVRQIPGAESLLPDVVAAYHQRFPAVEIDLREIPLDEWHPELQQQEIQIEYSTVFKNQNISGTFNSEIMLHIPFVAVCSPQHRLATQSPVKLHELAPESFVGFSRQVAGPCYDHILQLCGFTPRIVQEVTDSTLLLGLIASNIAISLLPASSLLLHHPGVVCCPLDDTQGGIAFETRLLWRKQETSPLVQAFLAIAREVRSQKR